MRHDTALDSACATARALVDERFPEARAAWLAGSVVSGQATATSDLDLTVLLAGPPAPYRESIRYDRWPVELFVHTAASVEEFLEQDGERRRPTLGRLIGEGVRLMDVDGAAEPVEQRCRDFLDAGPRPLSQAERDGLRYFLSDQLDDLGDATDPALRAAVAVQVWQFAADLLLSEAGAWRGGGKWVVRELWAYDAARGGDLGARLCDGFVAAVAGKVGQLAAAATEVLDASGGRLWEGYRLGG